MDCTLEGACIAPKTSTAETCSNVRLRLQQILLFRIMYNRFIWRAVPFYIPRLDVRKRPNRGVTLWS